MSHRRLIIGLSVLLLSAGCAHQASQPASPDSEAEVAEDFIEPIDFASEFEAPGLRMAPFELAAAKQPETAAEPEGDLWDRIRAGLQLEPKKHPRVEAELAYYGKHPAYMARVAQRAEPYLHYIVEQLEQRDMPLEIALLPVIESAYRPFAYSPGRAAGIWQFIPSTGRHYGLKQSWWYDGRRDVMASTKAALDYLQRLHDYFDDWELALASYNAGEGTVMRAIRANQRQGKPTDYWNLPLPRETRNYIPRLLAIRALVAEPERYQLSLPSIPNQPYLTVVEVGSQIDLALAAELAELSVEDLYKLNPGFNRWATDPEGPHLLVVPIETAEFFELALSDLPPQQRVRWERHQIASGDTLIGIANRYHTTVEVLKQVNELRGNTIRAGRHLIVPVASKAEDHYVLSATQRLAQTQQQTRQGHKHIHSIQRGDTLWDIARRYGATPQQLASWNGLSPKDTLRPGQDLVIWTKAPVAAPPSHKIRPPIEAQPIRYKVRQGDSLYVIARKFNVSVDDLLRWNKLSKQSYLQPGQQLMVHVDVTGGSI